MTNTPERQTYWLCAIAILLMAASLALPQVFAGNQTGLAAGTTAAVTFVGFFGTASLLSLVLLVMTLLKRQSLRTSAKLAGFAPAVISVIIVAVVATVAVKKSAAAREEHRQ